MNVPPFRLRDAYGDVLEVSVDGKGRYDALRFVRVVIRDEDRLDAAVLLEPADLLGLRNWIDEVLSGSQPAALKRGGGRRQELPDQRKV
jgi:hypothetical protein